MSLRYLILILFTLWLSACETAFDYVSDPSAINESPEKVGAIIVFEDFVIPTTSEDRERVRKDRRWELYFRTKAYVSNNPIYTYGDELPGSHFSIGTFYRPTQFAVMSSRTPDGQYLACYHDAAYIFEAKPDVINFVPNIFDWRKSLDSPEPEGLFSSEYLNQRRAAIRTALSKKYSVTENRKIQYAKPIALVDFRDVTKVSNFLNRNRCNHKMDFKIIKSLKLSNEI